MSIRGPGTIYWAAKAGIREIAFKTNANLIVFNVNYASQKGLRTSIKYTSPIVRLEHKREILVFLGRVVADPSAGKCKATEVLAADPVLRAALETRWPLRQARSSQCGSDFFG